MAHPKLMQKIRERLEETWDGPVIDENEPFPSSAETDDAPLRSFMGLSYPVDYARQASVGNPGGNWFRHTGSAVVTMFIERDLKGSAEEARQICENIAMTFRGKDLGDGVRTFAPTSPGYTSDNDEGAYYRLSFAIPYQCDIQA